MLKKDKKGVELSINTLIIAILVILVLIIIVIFFLGGAKKVTDTIGGIFFKTTAGTDRSLSVQTCGTYCDQAQLSTSSAFRKSSSYCKSWFNIDQDSNGEADFIGSGTDKKYIKFYCFKKTLQEDERSLDISCTERDSGNQLEC